MPTCSLKNIGVVDFICSHTPIFCLSTECFKPGQEEGAPIGRCSREKSDGARKEHGENSGPPVSLLISWTGFELLYFRLNVRNVHEKTYKTLGTNKIASGSRSGIIKLQSSH